jgi:hypothetical protein
MSWIEESLALLENDRHWGYREGEAPACEPAALAALALAAHKRGTTARRIGDWLVEQQATSGSVGVRHQDTDPHWPTGWAILAWTLLASQAEPSPDERRLYRQPISRAVTWLLTMAGNPLPRTREMGHDMSLVGWPWVEGTHSWLEPTAINVVALKANGEWQHPRVREGVKLIFDRLLPDGGCNYGNTTVFGQALRPHVQPSGLALLALAGESAPPSDPRLDHTKEHVLTKLGPETTAASLGYGLLGLAAHDRFPEKAADWIATAAQRTRGRGADLPRLSVLLLAERGPATPLVTLIRQGAPR